MVAASSNLSVIVAGVDSASPLYCSIDGGSEWTTCAPNVLYADVAVSGSGAKLIAAPRFGLPFISYDTGATWIVISQVINQTGSKRYSASPSINQWVSVGISTDGLKMVVAAAYELFVSSDGGSSWSRLALPSMTEALQAVISPDGNAIYIPTHTNDPFGGVNGENRAGPVYKSVLTNGAWGSLAAVYAEPLALHMLMACGGVNGAFVVGMSRFDVFTSTNGGKKWAEADWGTNRLTSVAMSGDGKRVYLASSNSTGTGSIFASYDSGKSYAATGVGRNWVGLASNTAGSKLVAIASPDFVYFGDAIGTARPSWGPPVEFR